MYVQKQSIENPEVIFEHFVFWKKNENKKLDQIFFDEIGKKYFFKLKSYL